MSIVERLRRSLLAGVSATVLGVSAVTILAVAAPIASRADEAAAAWQDFTAASWKQWTSSATGPVAVVFTTTDCEYCPAVIKQLREYVDRLPAPRPALRVVITDGANLSESVGAQRWYGLADTRHVFRGAELPLRYAVNPRWRGETPYVALLTPPDVPRFVAGVPSAADLEVLRKGK